MGVDLGTYHVHVTFEDGDGFIMEWGTGARYCEGRASIRPLGADRIEPPWEDESDLAGSVRFSFLENNFSCDCNLAGFLADAKKGVDHETPCGDSMAETIESIVLERPDGSKVRIFEKGETP